MNRRAGWQAASLGAAKLIRVTKLTRIHATDAPQLAGGLFTKMASLKVNPSLPGEGFTFSVGLVSSRRLSF
jgi:hypothetical protein